MTDPKLRDLEARLDALVNASPQVTGQLLLPEAAAQPPDIPLSGVVLWCQGADNLWVRDPSGLNMPLDRSSVSVNHYLLAYNATSPTQFSEAADVGAGELEGPTSAIEIEIAGVGAFGGNTLNIYLSIDGSNVNTVNIGAGAVGSGSGCGYRIRTLLAVYQTGISGMCNVDTDGLIAYTGGNRLFTGAIGYGAPVIGSASGIAIDTTVSHTIMIVAAWGGSNAAQGLTTRTTRISRFSG